MPRFDTRPAMAALLLGLGLALLQPAWAGEGHDHGEAPSAAATPAWPRFSASSELFELVGVVKGKQISLYLDHAATNAPVQKAELDLEIGGLKLKAEPHGEGEFEVNLAQELKPGELAVTATVRTATDADLLAGELDLHADVHTEASHGPAWKAIAGWAMLGLAGAAALFMAWRRTHRTSRASPRFGSAA